MKIRIIIDDVDVSVAQLLGLLTNDENVKVEKVVEAAPVVAKPTKKTVPLAKAFKESKAKASSQYTCDRCDKKYTYSQSYNSHRKHCKPVKETPKPKEKKVAEKKFKRTITIPKKSTKAPKYAGITDADLLDMVLSALTGNPNTIVTSAQITSNYVASVRRKFGKTLEVTRMANELESRVVKVIARVAKALGASQCMSMPISPNGLQVVLYPKSGLTLKSLKKKLE